MSIDNRNLNILVVGSEGSGKTSLLNQFINGSYNEKDPMEDTLFMVFNKTVWFSGYRTNVSIQDTKSTDEFLFHRIPLYREAHVIIITFSVGCRASYYEACSKWYDEAQEYGPGIPVMIVGCKEDLYKNSHSISRRRLMDESLLGRTEILDKMRRLQPAQYCECSARTNSGIKPIFDHAAQLTLACLQSNPTNYRTFPSLPTNSHHRRSTNSSIVSLSSILRVMRVLM